MLDCVVIKDFVDDLSSDYNIELFFVSFGGSTVPLSQFTSRDYMKDLSKTSISSTPTIIDNGWEVTVKFQYTELRKFTKVYLIYVINNQYKLAYVFDAADLQVYTNYIKLDLSDFECNATINTSHKIDNIVYYHRHTEADEDNTQNNRVPPQKDLMETITGLPQITSSGMKFLTINDFGLTEKESKVTVDEAFVDSRLKPTEKTLGVNFINTFLLEYDTKESSQINPEELDLITVSGAEYTCDIYCTDFGKEIEDVSNQIGTLKFFPTIEHLNSFNGKYLVCDGSEVDENLYPEYIRLYGKKFNNRTPDLSNGYIRSSGYMDLVTKNGYPDFSENPSRLKSHNHSYVQKTFRNATRRGGTDNFHNWINQNTNASSFKTTDGSDVMVAKSFIGLWGIKAR